MMLEICVIGDGMTIYVRERGVLRFYNPDSDGVLTVEELRRAKKIGFNQSLKNFSEIYQKNKNQKNIQKSNKAKS